MYYGRQTCILILVCMMIVHAMSTSFNRDNMVHKHKKINVSHHNKILKKMNKHKVHTTIKHKTLVSDDETSVTKTDARKDVDDNDNNIPLVKHLAHKEDEPSATPNQPNSQRDESLYVWNTAEDQPDTLNSDTVV